MTVYARHIISEPVRSASETWNIIINLLILEGNNSARDELLSVIGAASSLIATEAAKISPIVIYGEGPRVRIYCLYGEDAITGENANEKALPASPINGDWVISLPCHPDHLEWIQTFLKKRSSRIFAYDLNRTMDNESQTESAEKSTNIDLEAFLRP